MYKSKFPIYAKNHKLLKLSDFKNLQKGDMLHLAVFSYGYNKWTKFVYTFSHTEEPLAEEKQHIKKWIYGISKYTRNMPLWVPVQNNHIKFAISSVESPIFLDKAIKASRKGSKKTRPSPPESATSFNVGTKKKGGDGNIWIVVKTISGVKRWKKS